MAISQHWGVSVYANGERILSIESNSLGGIENIEDFADTVRECAHHLLSFIGPAKTQELRNVSQVFEPEDSLTKRGAQ
jgi:hypothetical protein